MSVPINACPPPSITDIPVVLSPAFCDRGIVLSPAFLPDFNKTSFGSAQQETDPNLRADHCMSRTGRTHDDGTRCRRSDGCQAARSAVARGAGAEQEVPVACAQQWAREPARHICTTLTRQPTLTATYQPRTSTMPQKDAMPVVSTMVAINELEAQRSRRGHQNNIDMAHKWPFTTTTTPPATTGADDIMLVCKIS